MESEERLLCLLHFRTDIARCRNGQSVPQRRRLRVLEEIYTALLQYISFVFPVLKKGEGAVVLVMKNE